jgi:hypothetical protein
VTVLERLGRSLRNPLLQALAVYLVFLAAALAGRAAGQKGIPILVGAAVFTFYSFACPVSLVFAPRFWLGSFLSVVAWLALFVAISQTLESWGRMREDGMVFLAAFMVFPVALFGAGIARLLRGRRSTHPVA